jgi:uncharacterized protein involved in propanediol utilization
VLAECASDSIMIDDRVVLFAHRDGLVLETLGHRLPPILVVGCDTEPGGDGVDTLSHRPAEYDQLEIGSFQVLRAALRRAIATDDVRLLGRVATASARINQRFLPKPVLDDLLALCRRLGGHGVQVAHSGTVAGLVFDARQATDDTVHAALAGIEALGCAPTVLVRTEPVTTPRRATRSEDLLGGDSQTPALRRVTA